MTEVLGLDRSRAAGWTLGRVLQVAVWDLVRFHEGYIDPHTALSPKCLSMRAPSWAPTGRSRYVRAGHHHG